MATAETDLSKPENISVRIRKTRIIHPKRFVNVKLKGWRKIFGSYRTYIDIGDVETEPTKEELEQFLLQKNLIQFE